MNKKIYSLDIIALMIFLMFSGCTGSETSGNASGNADGGIITETQS